METGQSVHMTPRIENGEFQHSINIQELEKKITQDEDGNNVVSVDFENAKSVVNFKTIDEPTMIKIVDFIKELLNGKQ